MKAPAWLCLIVLFCGVTLCSLLQEFVPLLSSLPGNLTAPWRLALVVYYGMQRDAFWAGLAALWCGLLEEGLGGLPPGTALLFFCGIFLLCKNLLRPQLPERADSCALVTALAAALWILLQYAALRLSGSCGQISFSWIATRVALSLPIGAITGLISALLLHHLDWKSMIIDREEEDDDVSRGW